jgi:phosphonate transport system substrate-binding protein
MDRRQFLKYLQAGLTAAALQPIVGTGGTRPLKVGIFPRRNVSTTYRIFTPLVQHLGTQLKREVQLITAKDFPGFWQALKTQQFDLVHFNQYHYILANEMLGYEAIVQNSEFGQSTISGTIVVRKDSGIEGIPDLKGKTILFGGGQRAMQSYIAARWLLQNDGLMTGDYIKRFAINPPNAIISTYLKQADAAGIGDVVIRLEAVKRAIDVREMRYLAKTRPMPHLPWAVHPDVDASTREVLQSSMVGLTGDPSGQTLLDTAKLSGLVAAKDADYDVQRRMVRDVYGEDLGVGQWG